jgi:hypothetical protein
MNFLPSATIPEILKRTNGSDSIAILAASVTALYVIGSTQS